MNELFFLFKGLAIYIKHGRPEKVNKYKTLYLTSIGRLLDGREKKPNDTKYKKRATRAWILMRVCSDRPT